MVNNALIIVLSNFEMVHPFMLKIIDIGSTIRRVGAAWLPLYLAVSVLAPPAAAGGAPSFPGPAGWQVLCATAPQYCNMTAARQGPNLAAEALDLLTAVNTDVNTTILPEDELPSHDNWRLAPKTGDCEDYALTKKHRLLEAGWPGESLRFATVLTESGAYHAVLLVEHAAGRLVLDNRSDTVRDWQELEAEGYRLVAIEGEGLDGTWRLTSFGTVVALLLGTGPASND